MGSRPSGSPGSSSSQNGRVNGSNRGSPAPPGSPPEAGASHLPLLHTMAGLGAPDTSHLSTAVIPSVTVVSTGSWVKAGATSRQRVRTVRRECSGLPGGGICPGVYRTSHRQRCSGDRWEPFGTASGPAPARGAEQEGCVRAPPLQSHPTLWRPHGL